MAVLQNILVGAIQGFTEFLPVSSSGHLVLIENLFNTKANIPFFVLLHVATMLAVIVYFWKDIIDLTVGFFAGLKDIVCGRATPASVYHSNTKFKLSLMLVLATLVTGAIGFTFNDTFEALFSSVFAVGMFLILTGILIMLAEWIGKGGRFPAQINFVDAIVIGFFQGLAIAPGLSRSGSTISAALALNLKRDFAARFSFLLAIPAILAAVASEYKGLLVVGQNGADRVGLIAGFISAFAAAIIAIKFLMAIIQKMSLRIFAYYCFSAGLAAIIWSLV